MSRSSGGELGAVFLGGGVAQWGDDDGYRSTVSGAQEADDGRNASGRPTSEDEEEALCGTLWDKGGYARANPPQPLVREVLAKFMRETTWMVRAKPMRAWMRPFYVRPIAKTMLCADPFLEMTSPPVTGLFLAALLLFIPYLFRGILQDRESTYKVIPE